jgi:predicted nucleic-acid-binding protein
MISEPVFADTNLFLRYLTNDLPVQADAVEGLLQAAGRGETRLLTSPLVMAEIIWTLESFYKLPKETIQGMALAILNTPGLEVVEADTLVQAVHWYVEKNVDFIDAYHAAWMMRQGIHTVCTFDRKHFGRFDELRIFVPGG